MKNKCQSAQCENAEGNLEFKEDEDVQNQKKEQQQDDEAQRSFKQK